MSGAALPTEAARVPRAIVLGCAGERLTAEECRLFAAADPVGFVLFRRNCQDPDRLRALVAEMRAAGGGAGAPAAALAEIPRAGADRGAARSRGGGGGSAWRAAHRRRSRRARHRCRC